MSITVGSGNSGAGGLITVASGQSTVHTGGAIGVTSGQGIASTSGAITIASSNAGDKGVSGLLTFSSGTHYCIGAAAARLQGRVAIEELLRRCPDFEVDVAGGRYADGNYVRRHDSLPWRAAG